jgi:hypothetical protein
MKRDEQIRMGMEIERQGTYVTVLFLLCSAFQLVAVSNNHKILKISYLATLYFQFKIVLRLL